jgi:hypothetical protein
MALADDKALKTQQLYAAVKNRIDQLTAAYSTFEQVTWAIKLHEARAISQHAGHQGLLLPEALATLQYAGIAEPTTQEIDQQLQAMAEGILAASEQLMQAESVLVGFRSARKAQIEAAPNLEALEAISLQLPI